MIQSEKKRQGIRFLNLAAAAGLLILGCGLLTGSAAVSQGVRDGLAVCANVLIPSLFPFMVLSSFISASDRYARILSVPLRPITSKIYRLPADLGVIVLLSMIGGYPVGAKMIANLLEQGKIDRVTAERMLCFCVNSGPSFLISAVGAGMLKNQKAGVILFVVQTSVTLLIGAVVSRRSAVPAPTLSTQENRPGSVSFVQAVTSSSSAMIVMCAFAVIFSGILSLLKNSGFSETVCSAFPLSPSVVNTVMSGLFEVTSGCLNAAAGGNGLIWISVFVSFSGLSVIFQIISCFPPSSIRFRGFIMSRIAHAILSGFVMLLLQKIFPADINAWTAVSMQVPAASGGNSRMAVISACVFAMCSILVVTANTKRK